MEGYIHKLKSMDANPKAWNELLCEYQFMTDCIRICIKFEKIQVKKHWPMLQRAHRTVLRIGAGALQGLLECKWRAATCGTWRRGVGRACRGTAVIALLSPPRLPRGT